MRGKGIAAGAVAACLVAGGAWVGLSSATASSTKATDHGWPGAAHASAAESIASVKAAAAASGSQVLLLRGRQVRETDVDVNGDGFGPGDYFIFEEQLRNLSGAQVIGRDSVRCTVGPTTFICDGTLQLSGKGKITVYSALFSHADSRLAVTGGVGAFEGVGGQLTVSDLRNGDTLLALELKR